MKFVLIKSNHRYNLVKPVLYEKAIPARDALFAFKILKRYVSVNENNIKINHMPLKNLFIIETILLFKVKSTEILILKSIH